MYTKTLAFIGLVASASAFTPGPFGASRVSSRVGTGPLFFEYGKYDEKMWDEEAKYDVYNSWDPNQPRSTQNFNPFETHRGNSPDASGIYPGEPRYKDPMLPDMNFEKMMAERKNAEERAANPKPGDVPGAPGCKN